MASLCPWCGEGNCHFDTGDDKEICLTFLLKQQTEDFLHQSQVALQAQQASALAQAHAQVAQAQAHLAQLQLAQIQAQQLEDAQRKHMEDVQRHNDAFRARMEREKTARTLFDMSGANDVPCLHCDKISKGLQAWKNHTRVHYIPFRCNECNLPVNNNTGVTIHYRKCRGFEWMRAISHFESEDKRFVSEHKASYPELWANLTHKSF